MEANTKLLKSKNELETDEAIQVLQTQQALPSFLTSNEAKLKVLAKEKTLLEKLKAENRFLDENLNAELEFLDRTKECIEGTAKSMNDFSLIDNVIYQGSGTQQVDIVKTFDLLTN